MTQPPEGSSWQANKPTRPGWYAWRLNRSVHPYLAKIYEEADELKADLDALSWHSSGHKVASMTDREWLFVGPL